MNHFMIKYTPPRETFADDATPEESAILEKHFEYLKNLLATEQLVMAGRTEQGEIGIAIIQADNIQIAEKMMENDPAIKFEVFTGELYPFRLSLLQ